MDSIYIRTIIRKRINGDGDIWRYIAMEKTPRNNVRLRFF